MHPKFLGRNPVARYRAAAELPSPVLSGVPVLILSGLNDPIAPLSSAEKLAAALTAAGARVERDDLPAGHGLTHDDLTRARAFYAREAADPFRAGRGMRAGDGEPARRYSFLATNATISVMTVEAAWSIAAAT